MVDRLVCNLIFLHMHELIFFFFFSSFQDMAEWVEREKEKLKQKESSASSEKTWQLCTGLRCVQGT